MASNAPIIDLTEENDTNTHEDLEDDTPMIANNVDQFTNHDSDDSGDDVDVDLPANKQPVTKPEICVPTPENSPFADAISPTTLTFMAFLAVNANDGFLQIYKEQWRAARKDFSGFIEILGQELRHDIDNCLSNSAVKFAVDQPYTQFYYSRKPTAYHPYLHASFRRQTQWRYIYVGYFISVQPGDKTTVSVGLPSNVPADVLKHLHANLVKEADLLHEALSTPIIKEVLGTDGIGLDLLDSQAKTLALPRDIALNGRNAEALKYEYFLVTIRFDDIYVVSEGFMDKVLDIYAALRPFVDLLAEWLHPTF